MELGIREGPLAQAGCGQSRLWLSTWTTRSPTSHWGPRLALDECVWTTEDFFLNISPK